MLSRFIDRDEWRENRLRFGIAGIKCDHEEPDWLGLHYRIDIDPELPLDARMRQWNERYKPEFERLEREGKFQRVVPESVE